MEQYIQSALYASTAVKNAISSWKKTAITYYMIFNGFDIGEVQAESYKIVSTDTDKTNLIVNGKLKPTLQFSTINYYRSGDITMADEVNQVIWTISCRAYTLSAVNAIATAVSNVFNRKSIKSGSFCTVTRLAVLPPIDETDNYNAPIQVLIKYTN